MKTRPLSSALGVEVVDRDLRRPLDADEQHELADLVDAHRLVAFRDQDLTGEQQVQVMRSLGAVLDESKDGSCFTHVSNTHPEGTIGEGRLLFHSDLAFTPEPIRYISLYGVGVPADGAPTLFADAVAAAERLDADTRNALAGAEGTHIFDLRDARGDRRFRVADLPDTAPRAVHPVLLPHPRTGAPVLYVSEMQTDHLSGVSPEESERLIDTATAVLYADANVYVHRWLVGDLVIFDNIALQHARGPLTADSGDRTIRRVPVGDVAVTLQPS